MYTRVVFFGARPPHDLESGGCRVITGEMTITVLDDDDAARRRHVLCRRHGCYVVVVILAFVSYSTRR